MVIVFSLHAQAFAKFNECFNIAGKKFNISPVLLMCIAKAESGIDQSAVRKNSNGTSDLCVTPN